VYTNQAIGLGTGKKILGFLYSKSSMTFCSYMVCFDAGGSIEILISVCLLKPVILGYVNLLKL
jgi:hypothetical protein